MYSGNQSQNKKGKATQPVKQHVFLSTGMSDARYCFESVGQLSSTFLDGRGNPTPFLLEKFKIPEFDECESTHPCAVSTKIPLQGTMYIYNSRICYYSAYNADTLVGRGTIISIPVSDILSAEKRKTGVIFDQGIEIILKSRLTFLFTGFKERDNVFNFIMELLRWQKKLQPTQEDLSVEYIRQDLLKQRQLELEAKNAPPPPPRFIEVSDEESCDDDEWEEIKTAEQQIQKDKQAEKEWSEHQDKLKELYASRVENMRNTVLNKLDVAARAKWSSVHLPNVSAKEAFILFFGNHPFEDEKGGMHESFAIFYNQNFAKEVNLAFEEFSPDPPVFYSNLYENNKLEVLTYAESSIRKCSFTHLIKEAFMPKSCECVMEERIHWVSHNEFLIERDLFFDGIPLSNSFSPRVLYQVMEEKGGTTIRSGHYIRYMKDTWFKSKIEKTSEEENDKNWKQTMQLYVQYANLWVEKRLQGIPLQKKPSTSIASTEKSTIRNFTAIQKGEEFNQIIQLEDDMQPSEEQQHYCTIF